MTRLARLLAAAWAAAVLAACTHAPVAHAPADDPALPDQWRTTIAPQAPLQREWWNSFGDPVLTGLVEDALANNLDVATAVARVREARAQEALARAQLSPSLAYSAGATRSRSLSALGQPSISTTVQPVFQAAYEVDLSGRIADQVAAARAGTEATAAGSDAAALSVAAATASGYITLRSLDARLFILQETTEARREAVRIARQRVDAGYTSDLEWRQAQAEYEATAVQVPQTRLAIARQEHGLSVLTGRAPQDVPRGLRLAELKAPAIPEGLPSELLRRRPDIARAERTLAAADATLAAARAQFLPSVRLTATAGRLLVSSVDPVAVWSLGASVLAPIFDGGAIAAQVDTAAARRDQAAFGYRGTVLTALREVEDNLSTIVHTRDQREHLQAQRTAVGDALFHASRRYRAGYTSYLEQLDAERGVLSADLALVQALTDELNALVALSQAMGGGWRP